MSLVRFTPDGSRLLVVAEDGDARLFDSSTGDLVVHFPQPTGRKVTGVTYAPADLRAAMSPDGSRVVTTTWDGVGYVWPVDPLSAALEWGPRALTREEKERYLAPLEDDFEVRRAAGRLVDALFGELLLREDVLARIRAGEEAPPEVRRIALEMAAARPEDLYGIGSAAWEILSSANRSASEYARGLRLARVAAEGRTGDRQKADLRLAVGLYRVGDLGAAEPALERLAARAPRRPIPRIFLAMTRARLGRREEARRELAHVRDSNDEPDEELASLLEEAAALIDAR